MQYISCILNTDCHGCAGGGVDDGEDCYDFINTSVYACRGTFTGGMEDETTESICNKNGGYAVCSSAYEASFHGLTAELCNSIPSDEIYFAQETSNDEGECYTDYPETGNKTGYRNDVYGCGGTNIDLCSSVDCNSTLTSYCDYKSSLSINYLNLGNDSNYEYENVEITDKTRGGVLCCQSQISQDTTSPTAVPTEAPTKAPTKEFEVANITDGYIGIKAGKKQNWSEADEYCWTTYGTHLASIHNANENADAFATFSTYSSSDDWTWIGLTDVICEHVYFWSDGSPSDYENWRGSEPNNYGGNEDCVNLWEDGGWNDLRCARRLSRFICNLNLTGPTQYPTVSPITPCPTSSPTNKPTEFPTDETAAPSTNPTFYPTSQPTSQPSIEPTQQPSLEPTFNPTFQPTSPPTQQPTKDPTLNPTENPTFIPTSQPTSQPTPYPTPDPTYDPSLRPSSTPTVQPSMTPTTAPVIVEEINYDESVNSGNGSYIIDLTDDFVVYPSNMTKMEIAEMYNISISCTVANTTRMCPDGLITYYNETHLILDTDYLNDSLSYVFDIEIIDTTSSNNEMVEAELTVNVKY